MNGLGILELTGRDGEDLHIIIDGSLRIHHIVWNGNASMIVTNFGQYYVKQQPKEIFDALSRILRGDRALN